MNSFCDIHKTGDAADLQVLASRKASIAQAGDGGGALACEKKSVAGAVSQRACVFCGSRVVLYPIVDALHVVHGPIGCAAYTWDIRGALSSGPELHRMSFCTDLREIDIISGGEKKLYAALRELIEKHKPKAAFVYSTCVVGVIGDDVGAVCKRVGEATGIPVIGVHSEGFKGTKKDGYRAACEAIEKIIALGGPQEKEPLSINILGDFNVAGELWIIRQYLDKIGVKVASSITGDGRIDEIKHAAKAALNIVQCSGSMTWLAEQIKKKYGIPFIRVSFHGIEDTAGALYAIAEHFSDENMLRKARLLVKEEVARIMPEIERIRNDCRGKKAALYVGGAFKAHSLVKALRLIGMETVLAGSQTGNKNDYEYLKSICSPGTIIIDDATAVELARFIIEKDADLFIGGVKERPIAYKLGIGFCDHNHERKIALAGFEGMLSFAREVHATVTSPVWKLVRRRSSKGQNV